MHFTTIINSKKFLKECSSEPQCEPSISHTSGDIKETDLRVKFRRAVWAEKINQRPVGILMAFRVQTQGEITQGIRDREKVPGLYPRRLHNERSRRRQGASQGGREGTARRTKGSKEEGRASAPAAANRLGSLPRLTSGLDIFSCPHFPRSRSALEAHRLA